MEEVPPAAAGAEVSPTQTIYINNLNEKIKLDDIVCNGCALFSDKLAFLMSFCVVWWSHMFLIFLLIELKKSLHAVFSQFGKILEVLAFKTLKQKGQAWVVFEEASSASSALRQMQGFPFYDKPMRFQYAKTKSDVVTKADGTFVPREKRKKHDDRGRKKKDQHDANQAAAGRLNHAHAPPLSQIPHMGGRAVPDGPALPNNILFIQNLPHQTTSMMLQMLFSQCAGFKEVRMVEAKPGIAFIEYENEMQSTVAMQGLEGFKINGDHPMLITYAKK